MTATNGPANGAFVLLQSSKLALPPYQRFCWTSAGSRLEIPPFFSIIDWRDSPGRGLDGAPSRCPYLGDCVPLLCKTAVHILERPCAGVVQLPVNPLSRVMMVEPSRTHERASILCI